MANVDLYRQHIQNLLSQHASLVWDERIQAQTIFDTERDHYQLVYVGWRNQRRIYGRFCTWILWTIKFGFSRMEPR